MLVVIVKPPPVSLFVQRRNGESDSSCSWLLSSDYQLYAYNGITADKQAASFSQQVAPEVDLYMQYVFH